jgi:hypothetical protein
MNSFTKRPPVVLNASESITEKSFLKIIEFVRKETDKAIKRDV